MKTIILLSIIVLSINSQAAQNSFQDCVVDIRSSGDKIIKSVADLLNKNPMGILEVIGAIKEAQETFGNCKKVQLQDVLMWVDQHSNAQEKECLSKFIAFMMDLKISENHIKDKSPHDIILTDTIKLITDFDSTWNSCLNFF